MAQQQWQWHMNGLISPSYLRWGKVSQESYPLEFAMQSFIHMSALQIPKVCFLSKPGLTSSNSGKSNHSYVTVIAVVPSFHSRQQIICLKYFNLRSGMLNLTRCSYCEQFDKKMMIYVYAGCASCCSTERMNHCKVKNKVSCSTDNNLLTK